MGEPNIFSKDGRLLQVEYAVKNTSKAGTIMGLICNDGIVLIGRSHNKIGPFREKIYPVSEKVYLGVCGLFSDTLLLKKFATITAIKQKHFNGDDISIETLCRDVGKRKQVFSQYMYSRPFASAFLYAAYEHGKYLLYSTDPSGNVSRWIGKAYGEMEDVINKDMEKVFVGFDGDVKNGTTELFKILFKVGEFDIKNYDRLEVLHFSGDKARYLDFDEIKLYLDEAQKNVK